MGRLEKFSTSNKPPDFNDGPILSFLAAPDAPRFDRFVLLHDPPMLENGAVAALTEELGRRHPGLIIQPELLPIPHPRDYEALYRGMRPICERTQATLKDQAEFHVLLGPGTPQMHAIWVLLTKTVFVASTWQGSAHAHESAAEKVLIPFDIEAELLEPVRQEERLRRLSLGDNSIIAQSEAMRRVLDVASKAAQAAVPLLLLGPPGVGKTKLAQAIHSASRRKQGPFVVADCTTLSKELIEAELFGHVRGAYTGAQQERQGLFRSATGGTIFLDEIGELPLELQSKLLRVLQESMIRPVGSDQQHKVDVRVLAATNQDLEQAIQERRFREDLYYRLSVFPIRIPVLRERREDIAPLAEHFLGRLNSKRAQENLPVLRLVPSARRRLEQYDWPGNVRELENFLERLSILAEGTTLGTRLIEEELPSLGLADAIGCVDVVFRRGWGLKEILGDVERRLLEDAWQRYGTQAAAAKALGLGSQQAFHKKCRLYHITSRRGS